MGSHHHLRQGASAARVLPLVVALVLSLVTCPRAEALAWTTIVPANRISSNEPSTRTRRIRQTFPLSSSSAVVGPLSAVQVEEDLDLDTTTTEQSPRSAFGTKEYWDDTYAGRGDFPADEYSWYYGWDVISRHVREHVTTQKAACQVLIPGIGNDPLLLDLLSAGYRRITAQDYSEHAIERQQDLLEYYRGDASQVFLEQGDVRNLPEEWEGRFDMVLEKGLLDAVYLSGTDYGNVERAVASLGATLREGGVFVSCSGVVPEELRRRLFCDEDWVWLRDGSKDLQAGCFLFQKKKKKKPATASRK